MQGFVDLALIHVGTSSAQLDPVLKLQAAITVYSPLLFENASTQNWFLERVIEVFENLKAAESTRDKLASTHT
jgi:hypothetical protein